MNRLPVLPGAWLRATLAALLITAATSAGALSAPTMAGAKAVVVTVVVPAASVVAHRTESLRSRFSGARARAFGRLHRSTQLLARVRVERPPRPLFIFNRSLLC